MSHVRRWSALLLGVFALALLPACSQETESMATGESVDMALAFRGLMTSRAPDAFLVVTVTATGDFVQFSAVPGIVQLDFPLITARQRELQPTLEAVCAEFGLTRTVTSGSDGARFLDYDIAGSPEEVAETVRLVLQRVFAVEDDVELALSTSGFRLDGA